MLVNDTITGNDGGDGNAAAAAVPRVSSGTATVENTIIAGNFLTNATASDIFVNGGSVNATTSINNFIGTGGSGG